MTFTQFITWAKAHKAFLGVILAATSSALLQVSGAVQPDSAAAQALNVVALMLAGASQGLKPPK